MIQTASILWAVLATGGAVAVYFLMRREVAKSRRAAAIARDTAAHERFELGLATSAYKTTVDAYHRVCTQKNAEALAHEDRVRNMQMAYSEDLHFACSKFEAAEARATDLEDRLRKIEQARHQSAKHARAAQIAQRRAKVLEQASKLVEPKVDRIAA